jgi:hypothetical protein
MMNEYLPQPTLVDMMYTSSNIWIGVWMDRLLFKDTDILEARALHTHALPTNMISSRL